MLLLSPGCPFPSSSALGGLGWAGLGGFAELLCCAWCRAVNLRQGVVPELRIVRKQNKLQWGDFPAPEQTQP